MKTLPFLTNAAYPTPRSKSYIRQLLHIPKVQCKNPAELNAHLASIGMTPLSIKDCEKSWEVWAI